MHTLIRLRKLSLQGNGREPDGRIRKLQDVLIAALKTQHYRKSLIQAGLGREECIRKTRRLEDTLGKLPGLEWDQYHDNRELFLNPQAPKPRLQRLHYPLNPPPRTAILMPGFDQDGNVKVFAADWSRRLDRFRPEVIAAPLPVLRELARAVDSGRVALEPLSHALIPFTSLAEEGPDEDDRNLFWKVFQVPVFEQYLGFDGRLIAWECEAHDGVHVAGENAIFEAESTHRDSDLYFTSLTDLRHPVIRLKTHWTAALDPTACECGETAPRLLGLRYSRRQELAMSACAAD